MPRNIYDDILSDARVKLTEMFKDNFRGQGFFGDKWVATKVSKTNRRGQGSILIVTGAMRRSIRSMIRGMAVVFTSNLPYTALHNEGGQFRRYRPCAFPHGQEDREHVHGTLALPADEYAAASVHRRP